MDQARKQYGTAEEEREIQARTPHECTPFESIQANAD
jgi:hypothetical protein